MRDVENLSRGIHRKTQSIWGEVTKMSTGSGGVSICACVLPQDLRCGINRKTRLILRLCQNQDYAGSPGRGAIQREPLAEEHPGLSRIHLS